MENVHDVAQYIFDEYKRISGENIDELKLHKLLYYTQRESIALIGEPMFIADFEGWRLGPVCKTIRSSFMLNKVLGNYKNISFENAYIVKNIINEYGSIESWKLSKLSHKELSWQNSRIGLGDKETGSVLLKLSDIRIDAQKVRPYDHIWDMYYDEFDDVDFTVQ